jgi:hypothetical protein
MKAKSQLIRKRLIGAKLIGFDTSKWKIPVVPQDKDGGVSTSQIVSTKAGGKCMLIIR